MLRLQIEPRNQVEQFFDTREDLSFASDSCPISPVTCLTSPMGSATFSCLTSPIGSAAFSASPSIDNHVTMVSPGPYKLWMGDPLSVQDRRMEFRNWMCLTPTPTSRSRPACLEVDNKAYNNGESRVDNDTSVSSIGVLETSHSSEGDSSASNSRWSSERSHSSEDSIQVESLRFKIENWDDGNPSLQDSLEEGVTSKRFIDVVSGEMLVADGVSKSMMPSSFRGHFMRREDNGSTRSSVTSSTGSEESIGARKRSWWKRLGRIACIVNRQDDFEPSLDSYAVDDRSSSRGGRVRVHVFWKKSREFSAVYKEQDFTAHVGAIWAMKFSLDGRLLATGGEDGIVRVWQVTECKRTDDDLFEDGLSCIRLSNNQTPIYVAAEKSKKSKKNGKANSACVVIPPKAFRLSEEPLHSFRGHNGDILDLSWSKDKYLISSSLDKTVRLWQVGSENCLRVFRHNDYVTCVEFNPTEENFFISGSIDGKVRIWDISTSHVVHWSDMTEIVTAMCFKPDGKEVVVGSITGNCRFFKISDNLLQVEADVPLHGKKGSTSKRVTGFQFSQSDPTKLLITSADSQIRVLDKFSVVHKYKGFRNTGSLISASFTKDGRHIVSASEDSNVFVWSHTDRSAPVTRAKVTRSYERFFSNEPSVAIPWNGFVTLPTQSEDFTFQTEGCIKPTTSKQSVSLSDSNNVDHRQPNRSTSNGGLVMDSLRKGGSITWPEENLPLNSAVKDYEQRMPPSQAKDPHSSQSWGQVIVTAGCDGRIRVFCNYGLPVHG